MEYKNGISYEIQINFLEKKLEIMREKLRSNKAEISFCENDIVKTLEKHELQKISLEKCKLLIRVNTSFIKKAQADNIGLSAIISNLEIDIERLELESNYKDSKINILEYIRRKNEISDRSKIVENKYNNRMKKTPVNQVLTKQLDSQF